MITVSQTGKGKKYSVRLSGSIGNLLLVGIIAILKEKKYVRAISGILGIFLLIIGALAFILPIYEFHRFAPPILISGFFLFLGFILSGHNFDIFIGVPQEVEDRREAEESLKDSKDPYASLEIDSKRLSEYYAINQAQARGSFRWAVFAMFCGLVTIIGGVWIFYFKETPNTFLTSLSTAAGVIINTISGLYLYLHNKTQRRSLFYYNQLVRIQQLGLAIRIAEDHNNDMDKTVAKNKIIDEILSIVKTTSISDAIDLRKEIS
jgi:hypothetical protein